MENNFSRMFEELRQVDWTDRPDTVETVMGDHRCWYPDLDNHGRPYVVIQLPLPGGFFAEMEGGIWGGLVGLRYYPEGLA